MLMACIFGETVMAELSVDIMYENETVGKGVYSWEECISLFFWNFVVILPVYPNLHLIQNLYAL
jgi:hypothetical protein